MSNEFCQSDHVSQAKTIRALLHGKSGTGAVANFLGVSAFQGFGVSALAALALSLSLTQRAQAATNWLNTGLLNTARAGHTATLLPNGKALVAGGWNNNGLLAGAELYDPGSGIWARTGSLSTGREWPAAALLLNSTVLIAGGESSAGYLDYLASAQLYDPASGTWTNTGSLTTRRYQHTATLLASGKVLVAGGSYETPTLTYYLSSAELFDPATGTWTTTGSLTAERFQHTATLLPNGKVLVVGGWNSSFMPYSTELYDPASGTWTNTGSLNIARYLHTATLLANGLVLVAGGHSPYLGGYLASAELYDPASGTWTNTGSLNNAREYHTATLLPDGQVLVAGGDNMSGTLASAELYDPARGGWTTTDSLNTARESHTATLLPNGQVLVAGGWKAGSGYLRSAELYGAASAIPPTLLANAVMLAAGACQFTFTNVPALSFTVVATTNPALPLSNWTTLRIATELSPGQYQFTDPQASSSPRRFYRIRSP
jgi:Kelch motif/Galactose oxidase, central domain